MDVEGSSAEPYQSFINRKEVDDYYRSIFNKCDQNGDGWISIMELKSFVMHEELDIKDGVLKNICEKADKNNDGRLDYTEFVELLNIHNNALRDYAHKYISFVIAPKSLKRTLTSTGLYEDEYKCNLYSVFLVVLSFLQISLFYFDKIFPEFMSDHLEYDPKKIAQVWRYLTYMLTHSNELHLFANLLVQLLIGLPLEMVHSYRVLLIYFVGGIGGCLANSAMYPTTRLRGASAGVNSLYTAHIASVIINWREMSSPFAQLLLFALITICDPIWSSIMYVNTGSTTSYISHVGGAIVGLLFGVPALRNLKKTRIEKLIWWASIIGFIVFMTILVILHIVNMCMITEETMPLLDVN